ncbi:MAG: PEP-utilizing enzyme [candidate division WOR-3 bacterium]|nr:PEP-utilizing enzyme [candidate division WOR-3 bacterium]MCX7948283.1 PEP-utilizing enzyme [candidate division WOR-3 bacterium]MDW8150962.1 putative PEP-binding protein [candidate division WOR-3 bacterium]
MKLKGISIVKGKVSGKIFIVESGNNTENIVFNVEKLDNILDKYIEYLLEEVESLDKKYREYADFYVNLLKSRRLRENIKNKDKNLVEAISLAIDEFAGQLLNTNIQHNKDLSDELKFFKNELLDFIEGRLGEFKVEKDSIVIARNLTIRQSLKIVREKVKGVALETNALTSHPVLILKDKGIPTIIGLKDIVNIAKQYKYAIIIDDEIELTNERIEIQEKSIYVDFQTDEFIMKDGTKVKIQINIDFPSEIENIKNFDVGLFRTEYLYLNGIIGKNEQKDIYEYISSKIYPKILTIRLFDLGGDKVPISIEDKNVRGIRYLLHYNRDLLNRQISAIVSANKLKNIRILIPMVSSVEEVIEVKKLIDDIKVGIMIETPSSALITDRFKKFVDFFSLGTNDLSQYTLAISRENISFQQFHPSIFRLIYYSYSKSKPKPFSVCGDMASNDLGLLAVLSFNINTISIPIPYLQRAKEIIERLEKNILSEISRKVITAYKEDDIIKCLRYYLDLLLS